MDPIILANISLAALNALVGLWGKVIDAMSPTVKQQYADALAQPLIDITTDIQALRKTISGGK